MRSGEPSPVLVEINGAAATAVWKVVNEASEDAHAIGPVPARVEHMHVPEQIAVPARCDLLSGVVEDSLKEGAILEFSGIGLLQ